MMSFLGRYVLAIGTASILITCLADAPVIHRRVRVRVRVCLSLWLLPSTASDDSGHFLSDLSALA